MNALRQAADQYRGLMGQIGSKDEVALVDQRVYELWDQALDKLGPHLDRASVGDVPHYVHPDPNARPETDIDRVLNDVARRINAKTPTFPSEPHPGKKTHWWPLYTPMIFLSGIDRGLIFYYALVFFVTSIFWAWRRGVRKLPMDKAFLIRAGIVVAAGPIAMRVGNQSTEELIGLVGAFLVIRAVLKMRRMGPLPRRFD